MDILKPYRPSRAPVKTPDMIDLFVLAEGHGLTILRGQPNQPSQPTGQPLIVVFNGIARRARWPNFVGMIARSGRPAVFVIDHTQSWYGTPGAADLITDTVRAEAARLGQTRIDTLGFSMGGFAALAFASRLPVRRATSLAPFFSPDSAIVPEARYRDTRDPLSGSFVFPTLAPGLAQVDRGLIVHGMRGPDWHHYRRIADRPGVDHWLLPGASHHVANYLREVGLLDRLISLALADDGPGLAQLLAGLGGLPKNSSAAEIRLLKIRCHDGLIRVRRRIGRVFGKKESP